MIDTVDMGQIAALWFAGIFIVYLVEIVLTSKKEWPTVVTASSTSGQKTKDGDSGKVALRLPAITSFMFGTFVLYSIVFTSITAVQVLLTLF